MQEHFLKLEVQIEKLLTATGCLEQSRAADMAKNQAGTVLDLVRKLSVQLTEYLSTTPASNGPSINITDAGKFDKTPVEHPVKPGDWIVFYDMEIYRVEDNTDLGRGFILTEDRLCSAFGNRTIRNIEAEAFPMTMGGLQVTLYCKSQYEALIKDRPKLNKTDIRNRLSTIWFTLMSSLREPAAHMEATQAFKTFVETVEAKANAVEETTVNGVTVFIS